MGQERLDRRMNLNTCVAWVAAGIALTALNAQTPETVLTVDVDRTVFYYQDVADPQAFGRAAGPVAVTTNNFMPFAGVGDIVAVNGRPAKGTAVVRALVTALRPSPTGSNAIADVNRNNVFETHLEIQQADGTPIGSIVMTGLGAGHPPLGSPAAAAAGNFAITGGTGAFIGARGQGATVSATLRLVSMTENPINRRTNTPAGLWRIVLHVLPERRPQILTTAAGPSVLHADFTPVSVERPARPGEVLIMAVSGLGPARTPLNPGDAFPVFEEGRMLQANSPVVVTVNGEDAHVINAIGWPGQRNIFRVDFRVPEGTRPGEATVGLSAAWIESAPVAIPVRSPGL
jgi:hypothetical protein